MTKCFFPQPRKYIVRVSRYKAEGQPKTNGENGLCALVFGSTQIISPVGLSPTASLFFLGSRIPDTPDTDMHDRSPKCLFFLEISQSSNLFFPVLLLKPTIPLS